MANKKAARSSTGSTSSATKLKSTKKGDNSQSNNYEPKQIGAFKTLKIGDHWCYMRSHVGGEDDRTMFLVNLPIDTTEKHVRTIFQHAGQIESVRLWKGKGVEMMEEEEEEEVEEEEIKQTGGKRSKHTTSTQKQPAGPPKVVPLPSLDPRGSNPFLPTSTSAHITFLDQSSLHRALETEPIKSWPDPFKGLINAQNRSNEEEASKISSNKKRSFQVRTAEEALAKANERETVAPPPVGLAYLLARHTALRPRLESIKEHVDSVMAMFEYRLKNPEKSKTSTVGNIEAVSVGPNGELLDADGFTIVQSIGKYGRTTDGQGGSVKVARSRVQGEKSRHENANEGPEKKKKRLELDDFYRFQRREAKRQELADLRSKFQADQEKIKQLKANRNFKPF